MKDRHRDGVCMSCVHAHAYARGVCDMHTSVVHACVAYSLHNNTHPLGQRHLNRHRNDAGR